MPVQEDQNGVVMGYPADSFERYEDRTLETTPEPPCNNPGEKLRPCLKRLTISLLVIITLFLLLAILGFYSTYQNKTPDIRIESITASHVNASHNNTISSNWHLTFYLDNPNNLASIRYKMIRVSVFDRKKTRLSSVNVDSFYQDKREEGRMKVEIIGMVINMGKEKLNDAREMVVSLKLDAVVWLENKYMKNHWQLLEANCGDVKVEPSMILSVDGSGRCNVNIQ